MIIGWQRIGLVGAATNWAGWEYGCCISSKDDIQDGGRRVDITTLRYALGVNERGFMYGMICMTYDL